jgi:aldose 1-epimerase
MLTLSCGDDPLILAPEHGGAIVGWTRRGTHMFRHPSPEAVLLGHVGAMGCFPLVPFCNRIAWRRFSWAGRTYELAANFGDHPHAIHGVGWQRPWQVESVTSDSAAFSLHHDESRGWPFAFAARLIYRLTAQGLAIQIEATNLHSSSAPMGLGAHPYFPRGPGASIAFQADSVWLNRDALPVTYAPIPSEWSHTEGRAVDREPLDNCFAGWRDEARIPGMRIESDLRNLQVFTPAGADFFCVEPVSHVPDAINHPELTETQAMAVLAPNEALTGTMIFTPDEPGVARS